MKQSLKELLEGLPNSVQLERLQKRSINDPMLYQALSLYRQHAQQGDLDWTTFLFWLCNMLLDHKDKIFKDMVKAEMNRAL